MNPRRYAIAAAAFEADRRVNTRPVSHRAHHLHGHGFPRTRREMVVRFERKRRANRSWLRLACRLEHLILMLFLVIASLDLLDEIKTMGVTQKRREITSLVD
jgi:hypothetical protein